MFLISEIKLLSLFNYTIALFLSYKTQFKLYDIRPRYLGAYQNFYIVFLGLIRIEGKKNSLEKSREALSKKRTSG